METDIVASERATTAFNLETEFKKLRIELGQNFLEMGKALTIIRDNNYFLELGFDSISQWLSSPDISFSRTTGVILMSIYDFYIESKKIAPTEIIDIDQSKLYDILPVVQKHPEEFDKWFEYAKSMRRIDLRREIKKSKIEEKQQAYTLAKTETQSNIILGDNIDELAKLAIGSVDHIITRLPIVVTNSEADKRQMLGENIYLVESDRERTAFYANFVHKALLALKKEGSICMLVDYRNMFHVMQFLNPELNFVRDIVRFQKNKRVTNPLGLMNVHETLIWGSRSSSPVNNISEGEHDVFEIDSDMFFFDKLISIISYEKQLILDPFATDRTIIDAIKNTKRSYLAIDSSLTASVT